MCEETLYCLITIDILNIGFAIAAIVLIALVYSNTDEDPLAIYDKNQSNPVQSLFEASPPFQLFNDEENYCQCGESILNNICSEEQIISGCYDISKNKEKALLRNLDDLNCAGINKAIKSKGGKFAEVFDLGFDTVHGMAKGILVCMGCIMVIEIMFSIAKYCATNCGDAGEAILMVCTCCYACIGCIGGIAELVCIIILLVNFYKGTTTGEFLDWYEICEIEKDLKMNLLDTYLKLDKVYGYMTYLIILTFAQIIFNCIGTGMLGFLALKEYLK